MEGSEPEAGAEYRALAAYRHCVERIRAKWPLFQAHRRQRLRQGLFDAPVEKVAENILEDLLVDVLDWSLADVNPQIERADMVLSALGIKRLVLEVKRPGTLTWHRRAVDEALDQAWGYAAKQHVGAVAVSDGTLLYVADVTPSGLRPRVLVGLDTDDPPESLWWISVHGIYRPCPLPELAAIVPQAEPSEPDPPGDGRALLHPRYHLPARCFAYVGAGDDPRRWKLPYLTSAGTPDARRLPMAMQAILSNYRGVHVDIPRETVGDVLVRLARAAAVLRKLPCQITPAAPAYVEAHLALEQLERLPDVGCCAGQGSVAGFAAQ